MPYAIEVTNLCHEYGEREVLKSVDLAIEPGKTVAVVGPNGAGKTTLLRILATLIQPLSGEVTVLGHSRAQAANSIRARVGYLGHEPLLYRDLTALENLVFYGKLYRIADPSSRALELLEAVAISERRNDPARELSRGIVQRVALCRALVNNPSLILLDEPQAHLDPQALALLEQLIKSKPDRTTLLTTHQLEWALEQADFVIGLKQGRVVVSATSEQLSLDQLRAVY